MGKRTRVAVVKVDEYNDIEDAVSASLYLIEAEKAIKPDDMVLLKPNFLMKIKNACTEGDCISSVARFVKKYNKNIMLGDSPGQFRHRARDIISGLGFDKILVDEGIEYAEFEKGGVFVSNIDGKYMTKYHVAKPVIDSDVIINMCRPKSHIEAVYTGAVKNYWGIIPGGEKAHCHLYGRNTTEFGSVLVDNYQYLVSTGKRRITVMDARYFMEGPGGPANGFMRETGLVLAGYDEPAIDTVMLAIGRVNGIKAVPHLNECMKRGIGVTKLEDIEIVGKSLEEVKMRRKVWIMSNTLASILLSFVSRNIAYKIMRLMPSLDKKICSKCGDCYNICPNKAINWQKKTYPFVDRKKCISCLCCVECCPKQALRAGAAGLSGLFLSYPEVKYPGN